MRRPGWNDEGLPSRDDPFLVAYECGKRARENFEALFLMRMHVWAGSMPTRSEVEMAFREFSARLDRSADEMKPLAGGRLEGEAGSAVGPLGRILFRKHDVVEKCAQPDVDNCGSG